MFMEMLMKNNYSIPQIVISIILTSTIALSAHALILHYFHAPAVNINPKLNEIIGFIIRFATVIGTMIIYLSSRKHWESVNPFYRVLLFAILIMALTEQFLRSPIMEIVAGVPWEYQLLSTIPTYIGFLSLSFIIILFIPLLFKKREFIFLKYIVFAVIVTAIIFFIKKFTNYIVSPLLALAPQIDPSKLIHPPYGMDVMLPAYITFLEPTIASFIVFYLIKNKLTAFNTFTKGLIMGGLIIVIHGGIYSIVQIAASEGNIPYRVFYYGQFLWEYFALGILTAYSFILLKKSRD